MKENTRFRANEEPSRLDLLFTKEQEITEDLNYRTLTGKSDHILFEFGIEEEMEEGRKADYRKGSQNYSKTNFNELRKYFEEVDWSKFDETKGVEERWNILLEIHKEGIETSAEDICKRI